VALSLTDRANALWRLGRYDEAQTALHERRSSLIDGCTSNISASYYLVLARMALSREHWPDAQAKLKGRRSWPALNSTAPLPKRRLRLHGPGVFWSSKAGRSKV